MSTDIKLSKAQISKIIQSGEFLGSWLSKIADPLMKVAETLVKNILAPLGITAAASAIISNKEMNGIMKTVRALKDSNILLKGVTKTIKIEAKEQKGVFMECY